VEEPLRSCLLGHDHGVLWRGRAVSLSPGQRKDASRSAGAELAFYLLFWAYKGIEVDLLYRLQSHWFGNHADLGTIARKVLVDQFVYNTIWSAPVSALAFLWKESAFSWTAMKSKLDFDFFTFSIPVTLMSTWAVWIPAVAIIYCLPPPLQIPLFNLVLCFWVLVLSFISKSTGPDQPFTTGDSVHVCLDFDDPVDMAKKFGDLAVGGKVILPVQDMFWGSKFGMLKDAYGISWMFNCDHKKI
jgi:hypothetical protein